MRRSTSPQALLRCVGGPLQRAGGTGWGILLAYFQQKTPRIFAPGYPGQFRPRRIHSIRTFAVKSLIVPKPPVERLVFTLFSNSFSRSTLIIPKIPVGYYVLPSQELLGMNIVKRWSFFNSSCEKV
jgi:hypothetical protein